MAYTGSLYASGSYGGASRAVSVSVSIEGTTLSYTITSSSSSSSWPYTRVGFYVNGSLVYDSGYVRSYSSFPSSNGGTYSGTVQVSEYGNVDIAVGVGISQNVLTSATDSSTISRPSAPAIVTTYAQVVYVRYQQADGTWGSYQAVINGSYASGASISWSRGADTIYKAASISYTVSGAATKYVDVYRQTYVQTIQIRWQNPDETWTEYETYATSTEYCGAIWTGEWGGDVVYNLTTLSYTVIKTETKQVDIYRNEYPIHFNPNGGLFTPSDQYYLIGGMTPIAKYRPVRPGYKFLGWSLDANAETADYTPGSYFYFDNTEPTLYAIWKEINQSIYLYNDGRCYAGQFVEDEKCGFGPHGFLYAKEFDETKESNGIFDPSSTVFPATQFIEGLPGEEVVLVDVNDIVLVDSNNIKLVGIG